MYNELILAREGDSEGVKWDRVKSFIDVHKKFKGSFDIGCPEFQKAQKRFSKKEGTLYFFSSITGCEAEDILRFNGRDADNVEKIRRVAMEFNSNALIFRVKSGFGLFNCYKDGFVSWPHYEIAKEYSPIIDVIPTIDSIVFWIPRLIFF